MTGSGWVLLVALILFATSLLVNRFIDGYWSFIRLPITWFYTSWLVGLTLLTLPLFKYFESFDAKSASYLIGVLFMFSLGTLAASFWMRRKGRATDSKTRQQQIGAGSDVSPRFVLILLVLGVCGSLLLLANSILGGDLSLADRLNTENLAAIRIEHMMETTSNIGPLYGPANLMSAIGGLGVAFAFFMRGAGVDSSSHSKLIQRIGLVVLSLNIFVGLIGFGSRMFAVFALLTAFFAFAEGRWSVGRRLIIRRPTLMSSLVALISVAITLSLLWAAATVFLEQRVQRQDPQTLLFRTHRATLTPVTYGLTQKDAALQYFMFSLSYLTTPIPTLDFYLDLPENRQPGPFFGEYNFPAIGRWTRRLSFTGDVYSWERARYEIFKPLGDIQFGTNVWASLLRDLIADFGKAGALAFVAAFGFLSQIIYESQRRAPSVRRAGLLVYLRLILLFAGMVSILFMPQVHWPLYLAVFLVAFSGRSRVWRRQSKWVGTSHAT